MSVNIIKYPERSQWKSLMARATSNDHTLSEAVKTILDDVRENGDKALFKYEERFDGVSLSSFEVSSEEIYEAESLVSEELKTAICQAADNIALFHSHQKMKPISVETLPGVVCEQRPVAIERVGLYIPGGNSPLFSTVLMLAIPARIAGCTHITMCTPPGKDGKINPAILFAAHISGVTKIYKIGGSQAIAAMAYGTETIPKSYKIFGPGNRYVMEAKQQVSAQTVAIDMPAGPSEVMIIADKTANPLFVATDFLSQAEHGPDSQSILLTEDEDFADSLPKVIEDTLLTLPRVEMMRKSLSNSRIIVLHNEYEIADFANDYAPEHLIVNTASPHDWIQHITNAGSVFLGGYTPESAGDYASGTNHTLPTSGYAKAYSGVNLDSFIKKITFQHITAEGIGALCKTIETMAENEDLMAHKLAVTVRCNSITK